MFLAFKIFLWNLFGLFSGFSKIFLRFLSSEGSGFIPTLYFSTRAPIGYVVIASNEISTNQGFRNLVPNDEAISEYVYYYLKSAKQ